MTTTTLHPADIAEHVDRHGIPGLPDFDRYRVESDGSIYASLSTDTGVRFFVGRAVGWPGAITLKGKTTDVFATALTLQGLVEQQPDERYDLTDEDTHG